MEAERLVEGTRDVVPEHRRQKNLALWFGHRRLSGARRLRNTPLLYRDGFTRVACHGSEESGLPHFDCTILEGLDDLLNVGLGVRSRQEARKSFTDVNTLFPHAWVTATSEVEQADCRVKLGPRKFSL